MRFKHRGDVIQFADICTFVLTQSTLSILWEIHWKSVNVGNRKPVKKPQQHPREEILGCNAFSFEVPLTFTIMAVNRI